jgi:Mg/Co/Ni transporter MgtE
MSEYFMTPLERRQLAEQRAREDEEWVLGAKAGLVGLWLGLWGVMLCALVPGLWALGHNPPWWVRNYWWTVIGTTIGLAVFSLIVQG